MRAAAEASVTADVEGSSVDDGAAASSTSATPTVTPTFRAFLRGRRAWIVIAAVLVLGALVVLVIQGGVRPPGPALGADNPGPVGSKALVEVLRDHGVTVTDARSFEVAIDLAGQGATVVLFDEQGLLDDDRLTELAGAADRLVVIAPGFGALEAIAPGVRHAGAASGPLDEVACELGAAERAGELSEGQDLLTIDDPAAEAGWQGCFADGDFGYAVAAGEGESGGELVLVAATTVFENGRIAEAGNAALAIGLAGAADDLVWYLPGPGDSDVATAPTMGELTPGWVSPVIVLLIVVVVVAGIWRGRRFGPLVVEQLPVHVPAGETSAGRARLYARSAARVHALDQLRVGALGRIAAMLRLPRSTAVDQVTDAAAQATGRDPSGVRRLLVDDVPSTDRELVDLAGELARLEGEVRRVLGAPASDHHRDDDDPDHRDHRDDPAGRRP
ncbi:DUF4350 domain-containing protein [Agromyces ramosus]|uniref:DUF4350 domain-containing protein n=1 Tax=Agromyces ramosus TaxID=33879 RepID=A0ABU0RBK9_9MICO|nr:DUF4350 domain-containing protein [Agromyces ramosus]MDQ0895448.1 hypothetical protein [Agromyces ramosus]